MQMQIQIPNGLEVQINFTKQTANCHWPAAGSKLKLQIAEIAIANCKIASLSLSSSLSLSELQMQIQIPSDLEVQINITKQTANSRSCWPAAAAG